MLESLLDTAAENRDLITVATVCLLVWLLIDAAHMTLGYFYRKRRGGYEEYVARPQSNGDWKWEKK